LNGLESGTAKKHLSFDCKMSYIKKNKKKVQFCLLLFHPLQQLSFFAVLRKRVESFLQENRRFEKSYDKT